MPFPIPPIILRLPFMMIDAPFSGRYATTFKIFVRDSTDGPSVDIGPDIVDSTGLDSFFIQGTLSDYTARNHSSGEIFRMIPV